MSESKENTPQGRKTNQLDYLQKFLLKSLCKHRCAAPFIEPVDPEKHNVPDYFEVIEHPMDLSTIRKKLSSNSYYCSQECLDDINLMFQNCYTYNGEESDISQICKELEEYYRAKLQGMPEEEEEIQNMVGPKKKHAEEVPVEIVTGKRKISRAQPHYDPFFEVDSSKHKRKKLSANSTEIAVASTGSKSQNQTPAAPAPPTSTSSNSHSVRREPRNPPKKVQLSATQTEETLIQSGLKACLTIVKELMSKKYQEFAWPFYHPVDPDALNLADYRDIIKQPRDLGSIKKKLESSVGGYSYGFECISDLRLMLSNCYRYNPPNSDVVMLAKKLQDVLEYQIARSDGDVYLELTLHRFPVVSSQHKDHSSLGINSELHTNASAYPDDLTHLDDSADAVMVPSRTNNVTYSTSRKAAVSNKNMTAHKSQGILFDSIVTNSHSERGKSSTAEDITTSSGNNPAGGSSAQTSMLTMLEDRVKELYAELNKLRGDNVTSSSTDISKASNDAKSEINHTNGISGVTATASSMSTAIPNSDDIKSSVSAGISKTEDESDDKEIDGDDCVPGSKQEVSDSAKNFENVEPMDYDEMRQITINMNQLPGEKILKVLQIIQQREPELKKMQADDTEVEIDLGQLRPSTLREIQKFVNTALKKKRNAGGASTQTSSSQLHSSSSLARKRQSEMSNSYVAQNSLIKRGTDGAKSQSALNNFAERIIPSVSSSSGFSTNKIFSSATTNNVISKAPVTYSRLSEDSSSESETELPSSESNSMKNGSVTRTESVETKNHVPSVAAVDKGENSTVSQAMETMKNSKINLIDGEECNDSSSEGSHSSSSSKANGLFSMLPEVVAKLEVGESTSDGGVVNDDDQSPNLDDSGLQSSSSSGHLSLELLKQEEQRKRMAMIGKIDINAQSDLLSSFEENL